MQLKEWVIICKSNRIGRKEHRKVNISIIKLGFNDDWFKQSNNFLVIY